MRVNPNVVSGLVDSIETVQRNMQTAIEQMSTGRSVNNLSDNPGAATAFVNNQALSSQNDQFLTNLNDLQGKLQAADSTLNNVVQLLTTAISLGTEGANGTESAANRQVIAQQVQGIQQQILGLANASYEGTYIFAGTDVTTQPFAQNSSAPSGIQYSGNTNTTTVQIAQGESMQTNVSGDQVFMNAGGNVFQALNDLVSALNAGTGIDTATTEIQQAFSQVGNQRVFYGNALSQIQNTQNFLNQEQVNFSSQQNNLVGADLTKVIATESQDQVAEQATLSATAQTLSLPTLLSFLK